MSKLEPAGESSTTSPGLAALADGEDAFHLPRHQIAEVTKVPALEPPAEDQKDSPVEAFERRAHRRDVGRFGVVVEPHPVHHRDLLERVR